MPQVEQSIAIQAPVETVFGLVAHQPERMAEWWPPIELSERVSPPPTRLGSVSRYLYNMMNVSIRGEHEVVTYVENERVAVKTISGINSRFDFEFLPYPEIHGTLLKVRVEYSLPGSVIGQLMHRALIEERNMRDLQEGLHNLKRIVETEVAV